MSLLTALSFNDLNYLSPGISNASCSVQTITGFGYAPVRITAQERTGRHGGEMTGGYFSLGAYTVGGLLTWTTDAARTNILDLFDEKHETLSEHWLIRNLRMVSARCVGFELIESYELVNAVRFAAEFKAEDPRFLSTSGNSLLMTSPTLSGVATNSGKIDAAPVFTLHGPITNPIITHGIKGSFKLTTSLINTDTVIINTRNRTVVKNGTTNLYGAITSDSIWWELSPGSNNVSYSGTDKVDGTTYLNVDWYHTYRLGMS